MLKFGREGDGSMGKTKGKNVVYVGVFFVFWAIFYIDQSVRQFN